MVYSSGHDSQTFALFLWDVLFSYVLHYLLFRLHPISTDSFPFPSIYCQSYSAFFIPLRTTAFGNSRAFSLCRAFVAIRKCYYFCLHLIFGLSLKRKSTHENYNLAWCHRWCSHKNFLKANTGLFSLYAMAQYLKARYRVWWCNGYRRRKWTRQHEFKFWTRLIEFHIALIPLGKVWIQLFSLQLWVNSRADWVLQPWWGN